MNQCNTGGYYMTTILEKLLESGLMVESESEFKELSNPNNLSKGNDIMRDIHVPRDHRRWKEDPIFEVIHYSEGTLDRNTAEYTLSKCKDLNQARQEARDAHELKQRFPSMAIDQFCHFYKLADGDFDKMKDLVLQDLIQYPQLGYGLLALRPELTQDQLNLILRNAKDCKSIKDLHNFSLHVIPEPKFPAFIPTKSSESQPEHFPISVEHQQLARAKSAGHPFNLRKGFSKDIFLVIDFTGLNFEEAQMVLNRSLSNLKNMSSNSLFIIKRDIEMKNLSINFESLIDLEYVANPKLQHTEVIQLQKRRGTVTKH